MLAGSGPVGAATSSLECGLFRDFVAPDPLGPTDGSITFGLSGTPEAIAPDATLVPPADTTLAGLAGGVPTALTVVRDAGKITSLAFAAECTLSGSVTFVADLFGPGADGYTLNGRLVAPVALMAINDGIAALIPTAAANGANLSLTFTIDGATGTPSAFHAAVTLRGRVRLRNNGDIVVGEARLPDSVIGQAARNKLREAHRLGVDATVFVTGKGGPDAGAPGGVAMAITLAVRFERPQPHRGGPEPNEDVPDTATASVAGQPAPVAVLILGIALFVTAAFSTTRKRPALR